MPKPRKYTPLNVNLSSVDHRRLAEMAKELSTDQEL